jgi:hypothetical protein
MIRNRSLDPFQKQSRRRKRPDPAKYVSDESDDNDKWSGKAESTQEESSVGEDLSDGGDLSYFESSPIKIEGEYSQAMVSLAMHWQCFMLITLQHDKSKQPLHIDLVLCSTHATSPRSAVLMDI